jgi:hypothetical protein
MKFDSASLWIPGLKRPPSRIVHGTYPDFSDRSLSLVFARAVPFLMFEPLNPIPFTASFPTITTNVTSATSGPHFIPLVFEPTFEPAAASFLLSIDAKEENGPPPMRKSVHNPAMPRFVRTSIL